MGWERDGSSWTQIQLHTRWVVAERVVARRERRGNFVLVASIRAYSDINSRVCPRFETKVSSLDSCRPTMRTSSFFAAGTVAVSVSDRGLNPEGLRAFTA